ncbi:MAG TPA: sigma-70 family RNA polymerase sigma factor [Sphingomicrobium sp.]|nr:sigma-70 family RNA polymerase sigma factor [Sphingomicrobium sp.]
MLAQDSSVSDQESESEQLRSALKKVADGDRAALQFVYRRTSAKLFGICLRILGDRMEAEDALQEVYVSLWRRAGSYDPERGSPISWLATFARNRAIDRLRSSSRLRETESIDQAGGVADTQPSAFAMIAGRQEAQRLTGCIDALEERQRGAIRSAFFDGFTYAELAARSNTPLGTMKSWVRRGLAQLKACLEQ